jgi:hypothetical protein
VLRRSCVGRPSQKVEPVSLEQGAAVAAFADFAAAAIVAGVVLRTHDDGKLAGLRVAVVAAVAGSVGRFLPVTVC